MKRILARIVLLYVLALTSFTSITGAQRPDKQPHTAITSAEKIELMTR